jgi:hypothetical protein
MPKMLSNSKANPEEIKKTPSNDPTRNTARGSSSGKITREFVLGTKYGEKVTRHSLPRKLR